MLGGEPSWRFLEQREKSKHDADGDQLEADGNSPLGVALDRRVSDVADGEDVLWRLTSDDMKATP